MADNDSASLRQFADIIQEKTTQPTPGSPSAGAGRPDEGPAGRGLVASLVERQPWTVVAGIAAGVGIAFGYLLGKLTR